MIAFSSAISPGYASTNAIKVDDVTIRWFLDTTTYVIIPVERQFSLKFTPTIRQTQYRFDHDVVLNISPQLSWSHLDQRRDPADWL